MNFRKKKNKKQNKTKYTYIYFHAPPLRTKTFQTPVCERKVCHESIKSKSVVFCALSYFCFFFLFYDYRCKYNYLFYINTFYYVYGNFDKRYAVIDIII